MVDGKHPAAQKPALRLRRCTAGSTAKVKRLSKEKHGILTKVQGLTHRIPRNQNSIWLHNLVLQVKNLVTADLRVSGAEVHLINRVSRLQTQ